MHIFSPTFKMVTNPAFPGFDGSSGSAGAGDDSGTALTEDKVQGMVDAAIAKATENSNRAINNAIANLRKTDLPKIIEGAINPITTQLTGLAESLTKLTASSGTGQGTGQGTGMGGATTGSSPEINAKLKEMDNTIKRQQDELASLRQANEKEAERAERAERTSTIRTGLGGIKFATDKAAETAFQLIEPHVKRLESGEIVAGDNLPVADFAKDFFVREHPYLLGGTNTAGSGAGGAAGAGAGRASGMIDMSKIKPGMSAQDRAAALEQISSVVAGMK